MQCFDARVLETVESLSPVVGCVLLGPVEPPRDPPSGP